MRKNAKTYIGQFGAAMVVYMLVLFASVALLNRFPETVWRIPLAVAPVVPVSFGLLAFLRFLGQMDELQQRIQLDAIAFASGATGMLTFTYGFLEGIGFPQLSWIFIFPMMIALWGMALTVSNRRYR